MRSKVRLDFAPETHPVGFPLGNPSEVAFVRIRECLSSDLVLDSRWKLVGPVAVGNRQLWSTAGLLRVPL